MNQARAKGSSAVVARWRLPVAAAVAAVTLLMGFTALPAAAGTDLPWWAAGLRSAARIDVAGGGHATSWGSTMEVLGAYLDDQRTIVVLKGSASGVAIPNAYLQVVSRRYDMMSATSSDDGYYAVKFAPLASALKALVPVTLHMADGVAMPPHSWTLTFFIGPRPAGSRSLPDPGRAGEMAVTFISVAVIPGAVAFRFTETGVTYDELFGPIQSRTDPATHITATTRGPLSARVQAFDRAGHPLRWLDTQLVPTANGGVTFSQVLLRTGPGPYRIAITAPSGQMLERTVA